MSQQSVNRAALLDSVNQVRPALSTQSFVPVLSHVVFDGYETLAYNDVTAISVRSEVELEACIPGELLIKALGSLSTEEVVLSDLEDSLLIASGRSKLKLPILPPDSFPFTMPEFEGKGIALTQDVLSGIALCLAGSGSDPTHPAQMGVTLTSDQEGVLVVYSTDNLTVSRYRTSAVGRLPGDVPIILPSFFCQQLLFLSKNHGQTDVALDAQAGHLLARIGEQVRLYTKLAVDLEPLDFERAIHKHVGKDITDSLYDIPAGMDSAVSRALIAVSGDIDKVTVITTGKNRLKMESHSAHAESEDSFTYRAPQDLVVRVDPTLLARALKISTHMAVLELGLITTDSNKFLHVISYQA